MNLCGENGGSASNVFNIIYGIALLGKFNSFLFHITPCTLTALLFIYTSKHKLSQPKNLYILRFMYDRQLHIMGEHGEIR